MEFILNYFNASALFLDGDSKQLIPTLTGSFDLVLVDGDHSIEGARADLQNAWPLVRPGGILVMDDICHPEYPWLGDVLAEFLDDVSKEWIDEEHGGCNAALIKKI